MTTDVTARDVTARDITARLWEWTISRDAEGGSAGVSLTRHGAMEALAKALVRAGRPQQGRVAPMILIEPPHQASRYQRGRIRHVAVYDGRILRWQQPGSWGSGASAPG